MAASNKHKGWLQKKGAGILAAVYDRAQEGTTAHGANTALDGVLVGTPVTPALAVDSIVLSNNVASGDFMIAAASSSGNSQAYLVVDASAGTLTLYAAGVPINSYSSTAETVADDKLLRFGSDGDAVLVNRSTVLDATTALTSVILGTPVTPAVAANSLILSNVTADGDILIATQTGGNSQAAIHIDASAGINYFMSAGVDTLRVMSTGAVVVDDKILYLGTTLDHAITNNSAGLNANTALANVLLATPAVDALPANSLVISTKTTDADLVFASKFGGTNSAEWLRCDTSAGLIVFNEASADLDFRVESGGNANMLAIDGGLDAMGIGGAAVQYQTVTITNAAVSATAGRVLKLAATIDAPNMADGYGVFEVDVNITGAVGANNTVSASSSWVNIPGAATVGASKYVCARNDGVYEESGAGAITNARIIFGARMHKLIADVDALTFPFSLNTNNTAITALFECQNSTDFGTVANAGSSAATLLPFMRDVNGTLKYVLLYDLA